MEIHPVMKKAVNGPSLLCRIGPVAFFMKPLNAEKFIAAVRDALNQSLSRKSQGKNSSKSSSTNLRGETGIEVGWASRFLLPPSPVRLYDLSVLRRLVLSVPASRYVTR
jgi:hypothetical protein